VGRVNKKARKPKKWCQEYLLPFCNFCKENKDSTLNEKVEEGINWDKYLLETSKTMKENFKRMKINFFEVIKRKIK